MQQRVLDDLRCRVRAYGRPPPDLSCRRALRELLATRDLYGQEPHHLAEFDMSKLKIARGSVKPKSAHLLLPADAARYLHHSTTLIERDVASLQDIVADPSFPKPFWDKKLRSSKRARRELLRVLVSLGLVSFRRRVKAWVGLFFVKKPGRVPEEIRMIVDGRQPSRCHRPPPKVQLGSATAMSDVDLSWAGVDFAQPAASLWRR